MPNLAFQYWEGEVPSPFESNIDGGGGTFTLIPWVKDIVDHITHSDTHNTTYSLFPEGVEEAQIPDVVRESWRHAQAYLSPEKQSKISYYEKNGEWFINIDGTKIAMQNETAENNPDAGINVKKGNTYFSQPAAFNQAKNKWQELPTRDLWIKIAKFLGGFKQLNDILQITLVGEFLPDDDLQFVGHFSGVWSANNCGCLKVNLIGADTYFTSTNYGLSVRLLDI